MSTVDIPGMGTVEFPDSMTRAQISRASAKLYREHSQGEKPQGQKQSPNHLSAIQQAENDYSHRQMTHFKSESATPLKTAPGIGLNTDFASAENDAERRKVLDRYAGKGNYFDQNGTYYVKPAGLKNLGVNSDAPRAVQPGVLAGILSGSPELVGMGTGAAIGAAAGTPFGPEGTVAGGLIGAALGGGAGHLSQEGTKAALGEYDQSARQLGTGTAKSVNNALMAEALGQGVPKMLGETFLRPYHGGLPGVLFGPMSARELADARGMAERGYRPPISGANPHAKLAKIEQEYVSRIFGRPGLAGNDVASRNEAQQLLGSLGQGNPSEAVSALARGEELPGNSASIVDSIRNHAEGLKTAAENARQDVAKQITAPTVEGNAENAQASVQGALKQHTAGIKEQAANEYGKVDQLLGNNPGVDTSPLRNVASEIFGSLPRTEEGAPVMADSKLTGALSSLEKMPEKITFRQAQELRSALGDRAAAKELFPGLSEHRYAQLHEAANQMLSAPGLPEDAAKALSTADSNYAKNMAQVKKTEVRKLIKDANTSGAVNPDRVARSITSQGNLTAARNIKRLIPKGAWNDVTAQDWRDITQAATDREGDLMPGKLWDTVRKRGKMMDVVYGHDKANQIRQYSRRLAALGGHISPDQLGNDSIVPALKDAITKQKAFDDFMKKDYLRKLADPYDSPEHDNALSWLTTGKGKLHAINKVKQAFGEDSPQMSEIRLHVFRNLLKRAHTPDMETNGGMAFSGKQMQQAMADYGDDTLRSLYGENTLNAMKGFADRLTKTGIRGKNNMGASLAAIALVMGLPKTIPAVAGAGALNAFIGSKAGMKWLTEGITGDAGAKRGVYELLRNAIRSEAVLRPHLQKSVQENLRGYVNSQQRRAESQDQIPGDAQQSNEGQ